MTVHSILYSLPKYYLNDLKATHDQLTIPINKLPIVGTPMGYGVRDIVRSTPKTVSTLAHGARSRNGTVFPTCLGGHGVRTFCTPASGAALWW